MSTDTGSWSSLTHNATARETEPLLTWLGWTAEAVQQEKTSEWREGELQQSNSLPTVTTAQREGDSHAARNQESQPESAKEREEAGAAKQRSWAKNWETEVMRCEQEARARDGPRQTDSWRKEMRLKVEDGLNSRGGEARKMRWE